MSNPKRICTILALGILLLPSALTAQIRTGAEQLETLVRLVGNKRVTLTVNHTSLCGKVHLADTLIRQGINIVQLSLRNTAYAGRPMPEKPSATEKTPGRAFPSFRSTERTRSRNPTS